MDMRRLPRAMRVFGTSAILALASGAHAQPNDPALAEMLFQEGAKLFEAGNYVEACPKFAASHKADPGGGVIFNLGVCDEKLGKTASAWAAFLEAAAIAKSPADAADAKQRADAIAPKLVRLQITVPRPAEGLTIKRDGGALDRAAWGTPVPVDPAGYRIDAEAPGKKPWSTTVAVQDEGKTVIVEIPPLVDATSAGPTATATVTATMAEPPRSFGAQKGLALAAGGLGVVGVVLGSALAFTAKSKWDEAKPHCDEQHTCDPWGLRNGNDAYALANGATGSFIVGAAGLTVAVILWLTAPSRTVPAKAAVLSVEPQPWAGRDAGGLNVRGKF